MYNAIWKKYASVIRILLKRAANEDQTIQLNVSDFEKTGPQKKTGFNFTLKFKNARVDNLAVMSPTAKELAAFLLNEPEIRQLLQRNEYELRMSNKFVLDIRMVNTPEIAVSEEVAENPVAAQ
jgi:hypothetical protein